MEIIAKDNEQQYLTRNQRNCVLFRMGEKEIYQFLVECADCMQAIMTKDSVKEAKGVVNCFAHFNVCDNYIKHTVFPLMNAKGIDF